MDYLQRITESFAEATGIDPSELTLDDATRKELLDLARTAAHLSGERTNAPLLCYVLGMLSGRGVPLERLSAIWENVE